MKKQFYSTEIESQIRLHHSRLSEKDGRQYAAIEAQKLPWGGKRYIAQLLRISPKTLYLGLSELEDSAKYEEIPVGRQRRTGGGRKKILPKANA